MRTLVKFTYAVVAIATSGCASSEVKYVAANDNKQMPGPTTPAPAANDNKKVPQLTEPTPTAAHRGNITLPTAPTYVYLTPQEVIDLKKTVATEWVQSAGVMQGRGIIDTILNRKASGRWGRCIAHVVNSPRQFSDINGRPAWSKGRSGVEDLPMSRIDARTNDLVDDWIAQRFDGAASTVGDHLNYANPYYSDRVNQAWISKLDGPVFGVGKAIHRHGTTADLQDFRPGIFALALVADGTPEACMVSDTQPALKQCGREPDLAKNECR